MTTPTRADLLVEIGTEEIPAGYGPPALAAFERALAAGLEEARLDPGAARSAGTARRIAVHVADLLVRQPDRELTITGPKEAAAFDDGGNLTPAALGFLRSKGASPDELIVVDSPKGRVCAVVVAETGRETADVVAELLPGVVAGLPFPKSMRWPGSDLRFARPIRNLAVWLGDATVSVSLAGLDAGGAVRGHPFLAPEPIALAGASFDDYLARLRERGQVIADVDERREAIRRGVAAGLEEAGGVVEVDAGLLEEVTFLVEWPTALLGSFDEPYLELPPEVLETTMAWHQRYFPVRTEEGKLLPRFVVVADREPSSAEAVRAGNERVLRARLADASYFWEQDRKRPLESRCAGLGDVLFHRELGSIAEKCDRLGRLVGRLRHASNAMPEEDVEAARRAAALCKADLLTQMVGELPELQGVMGRYYALADGEPPAVADAIAAHYYPRHASDAPPEQPASALLALAEQLDDLTAFFSIGKIPSGSRDPFGLRRKALGLIRLLESGPVDVYLDDAVDAAAELAPGPRHGTADAVLAFVHDRLRQAHLAAGWRHDLVDAAMAVDASGVSSLRRRIEALHALADEPIWGALVEVAERTHNIVRSEAEDPGHPDPDRLVEDPEKALFTAWIEHGEAIATGFERGAYVEAARRFHGVFAAPVHDFFDRVYVNVEDEALRTNRLALCRQVNRLIAEDFARLDLVVMDGT